MGVPDGEMLKSWRHVWRALATMKRKEDWLLSTRALQAIRLALAEDSPYLLQGVTTQPPPLDCVQDWPVEGACLIAYGPWKGDGLVTVGEVEEAFARLCFEVDRELGEPAACRWFLNWHDDTPRDEVRRLLLPEVERALALRLPPYLKDASDVLVRIAQ